MHFFEKPAYITVISNAGIDLTVPNPAILHPNFTVLALTILASIAAMLDLN